MPSYPVGEIGMSQKMPLFLRKKVIYHNKNMNQLFSKFTFQVFPWITTCVLINNIFELRADAYKYCRIYQRPFAQPVSNIGSWHYAFDILSSIAIATNTALIAMQPSVREYFASYNDIEYILFFVAAEVNELIHLYLLE